MHLVKPMASSAEYHSFTCIVLTPALFWIQEESRRITYILKNTLANCQIFDMPLLSWHAYKAIKSN